MLVHEFALVVILFRLPKSAQHPGTAGRLEAAVPELMAGVEGCRIKTPLAVV
jgi:hypothetical protein